MNLTSPRLVLLAAVLLSVASLSQTAMSAATSSKKSSKSPARDVAKPVPEAPPVQAAPPRGVFVEPPVPADLPALEQSRVVWGSLSAAVDGPVFDVVTAWLPLRRANTSPPPAIVSLAAYMTRKDLPALAAEANTRMGEPAEPFGIDVDGENYQAVRVVRARLDDQGQTRGTFPLSAGLVEGERFRLGLTATFDALVVLGNRNARGVSSQIYPAQAGMVLVIPAGQTVWLPLGDKEYFQFAGEPGGERLALTIRDPRSLLTEQAATLPAWRRDDATGSSFVQQREAGRHALIAEAIQLQIHHAQ